MSQSPLKNRSNTGMTALGEIVDISVFVKIIFFVVMQMYRIFH